MTIPVFRPKIKAALKSTHEHIAARKGILRFCVSDSHRSHAQPLTELLAEIGLEHTQDIAHKLKNL